MIKTLFENTASKYAHSLIIFITLILGIIWQGGDLFWFGPAAFSAFSLLLYSIYRNYKKNLILPKPPISLLVVLFTFWCFLTVFWSDVPAISLLRAITISASVVGLYSYFLITNNTLSWEKIWWSVIAAGIILFIYSCIEVYLGINPPNSLFFNKNTHASYLNLIILPTSAYFLLSPKGNTRLFLGIALFALEFSHALPGSRGATAGQIIGLIMIFFAGRQHLTRKVVNQYLAIYLTAIISATLLTSNLLRFFEYKIEEADLGRREIWEGAINLLKDTPWYGGGIGTFWLTYPAYRQINDPSAGLNAHNDYLQYLIETGVPGLAFLLMIMLAILYYWWIYIQNKEIEVSRKIEASGLIAGITAIGFHSFFSFNLGVFCVLYLIGLLLGRFLEISKYTKPAVFLDLIPIRKSIFGLTIGAIFIVYTVYFSIISTFSHLYVKGEQAYLEGKITEADTLVSSAMSIYPYDDRPYLFYVQTFLSILEKDTELTDQKKQLLYDKSLEYLNKARQINPHREAADYLQASLYEQMPLLSSGHWKLKATRYYQKCLETNPRFLPASRDLASLYLSRGETEKAADVVFKAIRYWHMSNQTTLDFYNFAEKILARESNQEHIELLAEKKAALVEHLMEKKKSYEKPDP